MKCTHVDSFSAGDSSRIPPMTPLFIVLDGPDGSGTSTHAELLAARLKEAGHDVFLTAEPTEGPMGRYIRDLLKKGDVDPMELQKMFCMDREWHMKEEIEPALKEGKIVICDRYSPSTIIYAEAQGLDSKGLKLLNDKFRKPDCMIFTIPPLEVSLSRIARRPEKEFFEKEELQKKIHEGYVSMAKNDPAIHVVDTSGSKETAAGKIGEIVQAFL